MAESVHAMSDRPSQHSLAFAKSTGIILASEIGDKTFFIGESMGI